MLLKQIREERIIENKKRKGTKENSYNIQSLKKEKRIGDDSRRKFYSIYKKYTKL